MALSLGAGGRGGGASLEEEEEGQASDRSRKKREIPSCHTSSRGAGEAGDISWNVRISETGGTGTC